MKRINNICHFCGDMIQYGDLYFKNSDKKTFCEECFLSKKEPAYSTIHKSYPQPPIHKENKIVYP